MRHPEAALFLDPGLGKTSVTLAAFQALRRAGGACKMLVVAPLRPCHLVWARGPDTELSRWSDFNDLRVEVLWGPDKDAAVERDADVYVINPDGLQWLVEGKHLRSLLKRGLDVLAVDELSKFKHPNTKRFKLLKPWLGRFKRRWGLTGSPASNGLIDLFGQVYVLDLGLRLGRYVTYYRHTYFLPTAHLAPHVHLWEPQDDAEKRIYRALKDLALAMKAEDHLDLPQLVEQTLWVDLPAPARRVYDDLERELIALLDSGQTVTAANAAVASGKCRQVASGGLYVDREKIARANLDVNFYQTERVTQHLHEAKTEALVDLVDELQGAPLLVAYEFHHDLERIRAALGKQVPAIGGGTTLKETIALAAAWNRGELPVLCGHPAAMGHGLNLQQCGHHLCWYTPTWDLELYLQTNRRLWRQGQRNRVVVHRICARKTVDEVVLAVLASKHRTQSTLLDALKRALRARTSPCT